MNFNKYAELAFALFDPNHFSRCFHVCFLTCRNKILSIGINSAKTHTLNLRNPKYSITGEDISDRKGICAELAAFIKVKNTQNINFSKCVLINIRINKNKELDLARPCSSCLSLISYCNLRKVFYSNENGKFEELIV